MRYLCLVYPGAAERNGLTYEENAALVDHALAYREALQASGRYIAASPLRPIEDAATVRVRNGTVAIAGGPYAETREQVGGFYLIEARDLNDAIRLAIKMPPARLGAIEVRPLREVAPR